MNSNKDELKNEAEEFYRLGKEYANNGNWDKSANQFLRSATLFEEIGESEKASRAYGRTAWNYIPIEKLEDTSKYLNKSKDMDLDQGIANFLWAVHLCLRWGYELEAREYFLASLSMVLSKVYFTKRERKKYKKLLKKDIWALSRYIIKKFYKDLIEKEKVRYPSWSASDKARSLIIMEDVYQFSDERWLKMSETFKRAGLVSYAARLEVISFLRSAMGAAHKEEAHKYIMEAVRRSSNDNMIKIHDDIAIAYNKLKIEKKPTKPYEQLSGLISTIDLLKKMEIEPEVHIILISYFDHKNTQINGLFIFGTSVLAFVVVFFIIPGAPSTKIVGAATIGSFSGFVTWVILESVKDRQSRTSK
ncbi:MAG: hypothetical protein JSV09_10650 [Thermoplasmata archaeon]|nr:MAG: hypothetical protein JSV09_10650 [Thermoplasmata archaeon]